MEWLKLFASFQSRLALPALCAQFRPPLSVQLDAEVLIITHDGVDINIIECSTGEYLLRGEVADIAILQTHIVPSLKDVAQSLQMDVFEEDGRLLKRITAP